ncbi:HAD hydrolase-like protein [soil metagenome]
MLTEGSAVPGLEAVLFDMDGVLVDVAGSYRRAIAETVAAMGGGEVTPTEIQSYKDRGGFNDDWRLTHQLLIDHGREVDFPEVVAAFQERYRGVNWSGLIANEPAQVRIDTLRQVAKWCHLALVTGRPREEASFTLGRFGWDEFFPVMIAMEDTEGRGKPDPSGLLDALAQLSAREGKELNPERSAYVGDTVDDMRAALAARMLAIGVVPAGQDFKTHAEVLTRAGARAVLSSPDDLPGLLRAGGMVG